MENALRPLGFIDAFYEGGAAAWARVDEWSDMDLYVVVEDGKAEEAFQAIEAALGRLGPIEETYVVTGLHSVGLSQKFYRLRNTSPFLLIDMAVLTRSAPEKYMQPEIHGRNVVHFDKTGVTEALPLDMEGFEAQMRERLVTLKRRTEMFHVEVSKELNRQHWVEALHIYRAYVLGPLVTVLSMVHRPMHHEFGMQYVYHELPEKVVSRLERLAFVSDPEDLRERYKEALEWFREVAAALG